MPDQLLFDVRIPAGLGTAESPSCLLRRLKFFFLVPPVPNTGFSNAEMPACSPVAVLQRVLHCLQFKPSRVARVLPHGGTKVQYTTTTYAHRLQNGVSFFFSDGGDGDRAPGVVHVTSKKRGDLGGISN